MNTANPRTSARSAFLGVLFSPVLRRFAWKEYRMVRGFWLAVLVLGVLEQWVSTLLVDDLEVLPGWLWASAWGAAALYAVGAAVTLFGAENEERTRSFLQVLPRHTGPLVAGKLAVALASSLLLALVLSLTGWLLAGVLPLNIDVRFALAIGGVAILETTAWGMLCSILWQQPLLAAVVALGAASFGAQLAIAASPGQHVLYAVSSYYDAIPARLAICLVVFAVDLLLARRWLDGTPVRKRKAATIPAKATVAAPQPATTSAAAVSRRRMLWRLVWQAWREAWRPLLLAIPVALFLMFALSLPLAMELGGDPDEPVELLLPLLPLLFLPALWGALVFRADQKGQHRLFLTTHAARPRMVWLSRQLVWLGSTLIGFTVLVALSLPLFFKTLLWLIVKESGINYLQAFALSWCAFVTAYCIGQLCSMLLKQEVLAGFLALLLSVVLVVWSGVVFYWGLPAWWFVLLLGAGAMAATWWWMPDWLVGRPGWRGWLQPAVAVAVALGLIALSLPAVRIAQVNLPRPQYPFLAKPLAASVQESEAHRAEGQETALEYGRLWGELKNPTLEELRIDGKTWKEWNLGTYQEYQQLQYWYLGKDESTTLEEVARKHTLKEIGTLFDREQQRVYLERNRPLIERVLELSKRPYCLFPPDIPESRYYRQSFGRLLLMESTDLTDAGQLDNALQHYLAWFRFKAQLIQGRPSIFAVCNLIPDGPNTRGYDGILAWAQHPNQTSERLRKAITELSEAFTHFPGPREAILADYLRIRDVINEKELPSTWGGEKKNRTTAQVLAYLANKLPWERRRALVALDCLTTNNLNYADAVVAQTPLGLPGRGAYPDRGQALRHLLQDIYWKGGIAEDVLAYKDVLALYGMSHQLNVSCQTSALVAQEFQVLPVFHLLRGYVNEETRRRALLVQLALLAYRLDHGEYPTTLDELSPEYLHHYYYDPFSGEHFQYRPRGLALPLDDDGYYGSEYRIEAGTPLLWSVGIGNVTVHGSKP